MVDLEPSQKDKRQKRDFRLPDGKMVPLVPSQYALASTLPHAKDFAAIESDLAMTLQPGVEKKIGKARIRSTVQALSSRIREARWIVAYANPAARSPEEYRYFLKPLNTEEPSKVTLPPPRPAAVKPEVFSATQHANGKISQQGQKERSRRRPQRTTTLTPRDKAVRTYEHSDVPEPEELLEIQEEMRKLGLEAGIDPVFFQPGEFADTDLRDSSGSISPLNIYFRDIGRIDLLTPDQEVELAKALEQGTQSKTKLNEKKLVGVGTDPLEEEKLGQSIALGEDARRQLTEANLRLVVSVARKYLGIGLPLSDLIQEGSIGLGRAVERFDYRLGFKFSTYATWWIRQGVMRAIADQGRTIRVPVHIFGLIGDMSKTSTKLQQRLGKEPNHNELAESMRITPEKVGLILRAARQPISLETPVFDDSESVLGDYIEDKTFLPTDEAAGNAVLGTELNEILMNCLPERERQVLNLRFGLEDGNNRTLGEIGKELGITRERVRQIEAEALKKLRRPSLRARLRELA